MAIYHKDGSVYKLDEPNKIMITQNPWEDQIVLHNLGGKSIKIESKPSISIQDKPKIETPVKITKEIIKIETPINKSYDDLTNVYCLPAIVKSYKDELYGTSYEKIEYSNKIIIKSKIIENDDLSIVLWTESNINVNSIVYPKNKDKRWWKIIKSQKSNNGFTLYGILSDIHPDFS